MKTFNFNGRTFEYDNDTVFYLEIGRYDNAYAIEKIYACMGDNFISPAELAMAAYKSYQVSNGYKKRLSMLNGNVKTIIARQKTKRLF